MGHWNPFDLGDFDRESTNESDGAHFFGSDNEDGTTTWYDDDGNCDCITPTPSDDWFAVIILTA